MTLKIGSLFSGYGGLDMAVESFFKAETKWFVEFDEAPSKILAHHWPHVPNLGDVTKVDWAQVEPVDIITGGFPCQPFSTAGLRKGEHDERHLWPHIVTAIRHLRPQHIILENVQGLRSLGLNRVLGDLAEAGFHARWESVRASHVGAPHHRERLFILASSPHAESVRRRPGLWLRGAPQAKPGVRFRDDVLPRWAGAVGGEPRFADSSGRLAAEYPEWMMGLPAGHVTSPEIGLSYREQLRAIGNGVCPQQALLALEILTSDEELV